MYKEDFAAFREILDEMTDFVLKNKGEEVISERHQRDFKREYFSDNTSASDSSNSESKFTDISFDDI